MSPIHQAIFSAWPAVRRRLLNDPAELRARLARRRRATLTGPPRAMCVALRASDRRINPATAAISPWRAADPADPHPHQVVLNRRLALHVCAPIDLTDWRGQDLATFAAAVGRSPASLHHLRRRGLVREHRIPGLAGRHGPPVPLIWTDHLLDPGSANAYRPPRPEWADLWKNLPLAMPEDFEQVVTRVPVRVMQRSGRPAVGRPAVGGPAVGGPAVGGPTERRSDEGGGEPAGSALPTPSAARCPPPAASSQFRGWRWLCPGCGRRVRTLFFPVAKVTVPEFLGDEARLLRAAGTDAELDGVHRPPPAFACARCHGVRYWTPLAASAWNQLVGYLTGGLMYGREVPRPDAFRAPLPPQRPAAPVHPPEPPPRPGRASPATRPEPPRNRPRTRPVQRNRQRPRQSHLPASGGA